MICLFGGPPHTDTYDLKPDAPAEYRGEFRPMRTNVPGVNICELFPLQARMWDKLSVIRSVVAGQSDHRDHETHTGFVQGLGRPSFGSVVSKVRGIGPGACLPRELRFESSALEPTYLGLEHRAFAPRGEAFSNLSPSPAVSAERMNDRLAMLGQFDGVRREADRTGMLDGMDAFRGRAYDMILSGEVAGRGSIAKIRGSAHAIAVWKILARPPACRSGRWRSDARHRQLGYSLR